MAPNKRVTKAAKGKATATSSRASGPDIGQESNLEEGRGRVRRRNREQIARDEQVAWELSCKGRGVKAERHIIRDGFPPDNVVIQAIVEQGLSFWFEENPGYNTELVEEFYKHVLWPEAGAGTDLHPKAYITSRIGKVHVRVTPDIIAASLLYTRPTRPTNYPALNSEFDKEELVCYNLDPRATEGKPSETTGNFMFAFLAEDTVCDWAQYIFTKIIEFRDAPTQTRMPFPCLISAIGRATGELGQKWFKNDELKPDAIDVSLIRKSVAQSSGQRSALLIEPPANANMNTWLKKLFRLEVAIAKSQQKLKREVRQVGRDQQVLAHQNQWLYNRIAGTGHSSQPYQQLLFPELEVSDDFAGSDSN
ncbi:hypothetical protein RHGRI_000177 [Rhododendron griersonianum]|uniref:Uncharacterized protein n=1 Tax=Rhododendron griersonianum TaxID=479676 RepID=A0AAV6LGM5_9ERIC|nr:hypothetical protein RHGRI_000177 [Rhododendron griersonianum]